LSTVAVVDGVEDLRPEAGRSEPRGGKPGSRAGYFDAAGDLELIAARILPGVEHPALELTSPGHARAPADRFGDLAGIASARDHPVMRSNPSLVDLLGLPAAGRSTH
jgi:hypothetical protein